MRAVVMDRVGAPLRVAQVPDPVAPAGGVVVEVRATGMCRSDWHAWVGNEEVPLPLVPGHELAGVVVGVGAEVERWRVGDRVTVPFVEGCGRCEWCAGGDAQVCPDQQQPGFTHDGSFAERVALHGADTNLVGLPDAVGFDAAAALGCRFATAYRALVRRAQVQPGEWLTVVGVGGVGLSAVMIGVALGARVVAVDGSQDALALARDLGAEHLLRTDDGEVPARVHAVTEGGAHVAMDAVGSEVASETALLSLRRRGRHVQVGLLPAVAGHPRLPMGRVIGWELDVLGSHGMAAADYPELLALIERGSVDPARLVRRRVSLSEAAELLPRMGQHTHPGITVIEPALG